MPETIDPNRPPMVARLLGFPGAIPIYAAVLVLALEAWPEFAGTIAELAAAYGAVILSFIGGAWWGFAAKSGKAVWLYWLSVLPSLVAWPLAYWASSNAILCLAALFFILLPIDRHLGKTGLAPSWWFALRWPLAFLMGGGHILLALVRP